MQLLIITIAIALFTGYAALIVYYRQSWLKIPAYIAGEKPPPPIKVSIIIPARNEAHNIGACLDAVCTQTYPSALYEVLVIDDHSTDATAAIVKSYPSKNVRLISLQDMLTDQPVNAYKKKAIEIAIAQSTGELIVTTDADCIATSGWIETMVAFYAETGAQFIAMPVNYFCNNNFIEIFQALDFMTLQGITGASVYRRIHSMCNGANIAYSKKAFYEAGGFAGIDHIASGDDMLLMHKIWQLHPNEVYFLQSQKVIVQTQPVKTVKEFFQQRIRWASKADKYDDTSIIAVLFLVYFFNLLLVLLPVISLFTYEKLTVIQTWIILLIGKTIVELFFLYPVAGFFSGQSLLWYFPIAQPFHIVYTVVAGWLGKFGSYQWKGREVK